MPQRNDINKILVIGAGPVVIGQGDEYDSYGTQACRTLRNLGYKVVVVDSNPATVMTRPDLADVTYIEPLNIEAIIKVIEKERPDAILPTVGGMTAVSLCLDLLRSGGSNAFNIELLGTGVETLFRCGDRHSLKSTLAEMGIEALKGKRVSSTEAAEAAVAELGFPVAVYTSFLPGGKGSGIAYNIEELNNIAGRALAASISESIYVEEVVEGLQKCEIQVMRDTMNRMITVSIGEFMGGADIHEGDSLYTIPAVSLDESLKTHIQNTAYSIVRNLGITGVASILYFYNPKTGRAWVHNVIPVCPRSAAFVSLAAGFPIAEISTKLACGIGLDEIVLNENVHMDAYVASADYTAVKLPSWDFTRLAGSIDKLGLQMCSTGEMVGIGKNFKEALQKAMRSPGVISLTEIREKRTDELKMMLNYPSSMRTYIIFEALRRGIDIAELSARSGINPWFIREMNGLIETEVSILNHGKELTDEMIIEAKKNGFSDKFLAEALGTTETVIRRRRNKLGIIPKTEIINGVAGKKPYCYLTYNSIAVENATEMKNKRIIVLGGGPHGISVGSEVDNSCTEAVDTLIKSGYDAYFIDCNPAVNEIVCNIATKSYIAPINIEDILDVYQSCNTDGFIVQFGGPRAIAEYSQLVEASVNVLGTIKDSISSVSIKENFDALMTQLGIPVLNCHEKGIAVEMDCICDGKDIFTPILTGHIEHASIHDDDAAAVVPPVNVKPEYESVMKKYTGKIVRELGITGLLNVKFIIYDDMVYIANVNTHASRNIPLLTKITGLPLASFATDIITGNSLKNLISVNKIDSLTAVKESVFPFDMFPEIDPVLGPQMKSTGEVMGLASSFGLAYWKAQSAINPLPVNGTILITVAQQDREEAADIAARFSVMGFKIKATSGTRKFLMEQGIPVESILKEYEGRPNITDAIKNKEIHLVINTPEDKQSKDDDSYIRKAAIKYKVPYITTITGALAAVAGIEAFINTGYEVKALQEYYLS